MKIRTMAFLFCAFFFSVSVSAQTLNFSQKVNPLIQTYTPHAQVGIVLLDPKTNQILFQKNAHQLFTPASNVKLFTASAALLGLGLNYRYETILGYQQNHLKHHVLNGNVYLYFSGDPSLEIKDLDKLIYSLKKNGVEKIQGNIILDDSYFSKPDHPLGISFEDLNWYYAAPITSIIVNENKITAFLHPSKKIGNPVSVELGEGMAYLHLSSHIKTVSCSDAEHHCSLLLEINDKNQINLNGCWPMEGTYSEVDFAVKNPFLFASAVISESLQKNKIIFKGKFLKGIMPTVSKKINHYSKPLPDLIQTMLKRSDNLYAEAMTKTLGKKYFNHGTIQEGVNAIEMILSKEWGIQFGKNSSIKLFDGEGTRYDLVSPYALANLLQHIYQNKKLYPIILNSLPHSHVDDDSTFTHFLSFKLLPANVYAKTGTFNDTSALSGYIKTKKRQWLIFSIMVNHEGHSLKSARDLQTKLGETFAV